jgi:hypothetical protein
LTDYFLQWDDDPHRQELHRVEELKAGDLFWVIAISSENPDETWQVRTTGPVNDGDPLIIDTDGKVQAGPAASTASVVAYSASQVGRIFNRDHLPVAIARETIGAAGLVSATIYLLPKIP